MARQKVLLLGAGGLHLLLILVVSLRDTATILSEGGNLLPRSVDAKWSAISRAASASLGQQLPTSDPLREGMTAYLHAAGIDGGYAFFAPNVPSTYKLVFELHYPDGRVEYLLPEVRSRAAGLRMVSLFDYLGRTDYPALRELIFRVLARSVGSAHPEAVLIRTVFGYLDPLSPEDFQNGEEQTYQFLYAYDFRPHTKAAKPR
jgi:hypothetical protein